MQAWEEFGFIFSLSYDQVTVESSKVSYLPSFLKAEDAQLFLHLHEHHVPSYALNQLSGPALPFL